MSAVSNSQPSPQSDIAGSRPADVLSDRTDTTHVEDIALMQRIDQGDQDALMEFYQRFANLVFSMAVKIMRNQGLAEEVTQDAFLKVWRKADKWDPDKGRLSSWLLTVTRFTAIDRLRKEQHRPEISPDPLDEMPATAVNPGIVNDPLWHDGQLLRTLIDRLPPEQTEVIELAYFHGMTHSQLADHLDLPLGTVKTRLRLGLKKLRDYWKDATETPIT